MICEGKSQAYKQMVLDAKFKNMIEMLTNVADLTEQTENPRYTKKYLGYRLTKDNEDLGLYVTLEELQLYLGTTYQKIKNLVYFSCGDLYHFGYRVEKVKNPDHGKSKKSKGVVILKDDEYVTECASVTEAANYLNTRPQNVSQNIRGKSNTVMGYVCVRYSEYYEED